MPQLMLKQTMFVSNVQKRRIIAPVALSLRYINPKVYYSTAIDKPLNLHHFRYKLKMMDYDQ